MGQPLPVHQPHVGAAPSRSTKPPVCCETFLAEVAKRESDDARRVTRSMEVLARAYDALERTRHLVRLGG
jgi:hypothetical protein